MISTYDTSQQWNKSNRWIIHATKDSINAVDEGVNAGESFVLFHLMNCEIMDTRLQAILDRQTKYMKIAEQNNKYNVYAIVLWEVYLVFLVFDQCFDRM